MGDNIFSKYALSKPKFLTLVEGEQVQVKFLSANLATSNFNEGECLQYHFEHKGINKRLTSASQDLAQQMSMMPEGSEILIKRIGVGYGTKYQVTLVSAKSPKEDLATVSH